MIQSKKALVLMLALCAACTEDKKDPKVDASTSKDAGSDAAVDAGPPPGPVALGDAPQLAASCKGKTKPGVTSALPSFEKKVVVNQPGAAYIKPADLNNDGYPEFLLTTLAEGLDLRFKPPISAGGAYVLAREGKIEAKKLGTWTATKYFDRDTTVEVGGEEIGIGFPNQSELVDIDNDGVKDWVIGAGFLIKPKGLLVWMKGGRDGKFGKPTVIPTPDITCWYHIALPLDMDGDGDEDFVSSCHIGSAGNTKGPSRVEWFENPGDTSGAFVSHPIGEGGGALVQLFDVDGDGDQDVLAPQFFEAGALVWFEQTGAKGTAWEEHPINDSLGRGFITRFADMNGDGKVDMVFGNHNNEEATDPKNQVQGIYWFDVPAAEELRGLANWDAYLHTIYEGFVVDGTSNADSAGAPGMLNVGDIDGDCDMDVVASGDGDPGLYVFVQNADGFARIDLSTDPGNVNSGEQHIFDLDGDGKLDIMWGVYGAQAGPAQPELKSFVAAFLQK